MSKNRKTTAKFQNPDDAPINYNEESKKETIGVVEAPMEEPSISDSSVIVDSSEKDESDTNVNTEKTVDVTVKVENTNKDEPKTTVSMKSSVVQDLSESVFTNYVSVRVIGRNKLAGKHMMSPLTIANMVMDGNPDFCILTSPQTARLIRKIIMNYGSRLNVKDASIERKEQMLTRFENNLKKFKF